MFSDYSVMTLKASLSWMLSSLFFFGLNSLLPPGFLPHHPPPSVDDNIAASDQEEGELEEGEVSPPRAVSPPTSTPPGFIPSFPGGLPPGLSIIDITKEINLTAHF